MAIDADLERDVEIADSVIEKALARGSENAMLLSMKQAQIHSNVEFCFFVNQFERDLLNHYGRPDNT